MTKRVRIACQGAEFRELDDLTEFQGELKNLSDINAGKLRREILELGFSEPVAVWERGKKAHVLNGYQRVRVLRALRQEGYVVPPIPVSVVKAGSRQEAKRKVLALTSQYGRVTQGGLLALLADAGLSVEEAEGRFAFPELDFDALQGMAMVVEDEVPEPPDKPITKPSEIVKLGPHRLLCGDATSVDDLGLLLAGASADLCFTDPPYNMAYRSKRLGGILNDDVARSAFLQLLLGSLGRVKEALRLGGVFYVCMSPLEYGAVVYQLRMLGLPSAPIFWVKPSAGLGAQDYRSQVEVLVYGWTGKREQRTWNAGRRESNIWDFDPGRQVIAREDGPAGMAIELGDGPMSVTVHLAKRSEGIVYYEDGRGVDVWRLSRAVGRYAHPTQKPVALAMRAILNSSNPGDLVMDPFAGSGVTLIGAEQTGRACYVMDLDPRYCDVIVRRYFNFVGWNKATRAQRRRWKPKEEAS